MSRCCGGTIRPGKLRLLHADERGSIITRSYGNATVTDVNSYDEYGRPAASNFGRFGYTGQMWLPEASAYNYKARAYSPVLGRFLQTDPIGMAGGINLYAYTGNDPVNLDDPLGLDSDISHKPIFVWGHAPVSAELDTDPRGTIFPGNDRIPSLASLGLEIRALLHAWRPIIVSAPRPIVRMPTPDEIANRQAAACADPGIRSALHNPSVQTALKKILQRTRQTGREWGFEYGRAIGGGWGVTGIYQGTPDLLVMQSALSSLLSGIYYRRIAFHTHPEPSGRGLSGGPVSDLTVVSHGWTVIAIKENGEMFCAIPK
jgi:RHS repeat-associated protein